MKLPDFITSQLVVSAITIFLIVHVMLLSVAYLVYLERKISAYIQDRIGPNRVGFDFGLPLLAPLKGMLGLGQSLADGLKFILKEDLTPGHVRKFFFWLAPVLTMVPAMLTKPPYDPVTDLVPISRVVHVNMAFIVPGTLPVNTLKEFVALVKANPGKFTFASSGTGATAHLFSEMLVAATDKGLTFPFTVPGSILGLAFSSDQTRAALTVMREGKSSLWLAEKGVLRETTAPPFANHPTFGPLGKLAYAGGTPVQRVYVDGKPISPAGFMASSPVFCDTPEGLLVLFTVQVSGGADIIAMDSKGGSIRRFTQKQGSNSFPACSPDGRLVAFFSTTKTGAGSGLYLMPVARPWLAKKISNEVGESLQWARREAEATTSPAPAPPPVRAGSRPARCPAWRAARRLQPWCRGSRSPRR